MATVAETFAAALQFHQAGNLSAAEHYYRAILQVAPGHADSHHLLGVIAHQQGSNDAAVALIRQALALNPWAAEYYTNLGTVYLTLGQLDEAVACCRQALRIDPHQAEIHNNLGNALARQEKFDEAIRCYNDALRLMPHYAEGYYNLGVVHARQGKTTEALANYQHALQLDPGHVHANNNLAGLLLSVGHFDDAIAKWHHALHLRPDYVEAHSNLAKALLSHGQIDEAVRSFRAAVDLQPQRADLHNDLGNALRMQGNLREATEALNEGLRLNPHFAEAYNILGAVYQRQHQLDEAIRCYQQAMANRHDFPEAHHDLGVALMAQGRVYEAMASYRQALQLQPTMNALASSVLWCLNFDPDVDAQEMMEAHCNWGSALEAKVEHLPHANDLSPDRPLRIGYVSPDFRRHPVMRYFEPVLLNHDRVAVEVFCYAEVANPDAVTARVQELAHSWRITCGRTDVHVAEQIRADRIDILVDLAGHTGTNRLGVFAHKAAPVQATWLGYLNTTGLSSIDFRLTDDTLDPVDLPAWGVEEPVRLPGGFCCFAPPTDAGDVSPLPALRRGHLTFGSLHSLFKLNAKVFDWWSRLSTALPTARLLVFRDSLTGTAKERIRQEFRDRGVADEQLDLRQGTDAPGYLRIYDEIDVSLDTLPWSGGITTCESLWMGVPMLSLRGTSPAGRNAAGLLTRVGLSDWAVDTPDQFVASAVNIANNLGPLAQLRSQLRQRVLTGLCDAVRLTRELEAAYRVMWRRHCAR